MDKSKQREEKQSKRKDPDEARIKGKECKNCGTNWEKKKKRRKGIIATLASLCLCGKISKKKSSLLCCCLIVNLKLEVFVHYDLQSNLEHCLSLKKKKIPGKSLKANPWTEHNTKSTKPCFKNMCCWIRGSLRGPLSPSLFSNVKDKRIKKCPFTPTLLFPESPAFISPWIPLQARLEQDISRFTYRIWNIDIYLKNPHKNQKVSCTLHLTTLSPLLFIILQKDLLIIKKGVFD